MVHVRVLFLLALVGCHRSSAAVPPRDPMARFRVRAGEVMRQARALCDSDRYDQVPWAFEIGMDDLLEMTLNQAGQPAFQELEELLKTLETPYSPVHLTGWIPVPGGRDYIVGYSIILSPTQGLARLRVARWDKGRYTLVPPDMEALRKAEEELAYWRGGDLHSRYGPPYHPDEIHLDDCWGPEDLSPESTGPGSITFRASYGISSTCPGEFRVVWNYAWGLLRPESYSWGNHPKSRARRFFATSFASLAKECEEMNPYEGK